LILRPAILGLCLAMIIVSAIVFLPLGRNDPNSSLPPRLFPAFAPEVKRERADDLLPETLVEISKTPRKIEILPGGTVEYSLTIRNISHDPLYNLVVEERFDDAILTASNIGSGSLTKNRIAWLLPHLAPQSDAIFHYELKTEKERSYSSIQTTAYVFGDALLDMTSASRMASSDIAIIELPQSGVELGQVLRFFMSFFE